MNENKIYKIFLKTYWNWREAINNDNPNPGMAFETEEGNVYFAKSNLKESNPIDEILKVLPDKEAIGTLYVAGDITDKIMEDITNKHLYTKRIIYYSNNEDYAKSSSYTIEFIKMENILGDFNKDREWWTHHFYESAYEIMENKKKWPVLIPSYNRPNTVTVRTIFNEMTPDCNYPVHLIVRASQVPEYEKYLEGIYGVDIISFPDEQINNLGAVRRTIVNWLNENGFEAGFMFDDDITELTYTFKGYTGKGELKAKYLHRKGADIPRVLAMWQICMEYGIKNFDLVASSISPMFSSWKYDYTDQEQSMMMYRGVPSQVMCINAKKFKEEGLVYPDTKECAHEDIDMAIKIVEKRLKLAMFPFLVYSANPMTPEFGNFGSTMEARMKAQQEIMYKNHHDKEYVRFEDKRGLAQVSINWIRVRKILGIDKFRFNIWNDGEILNIR